MNQKFLNKKTVTAATTLATAASFLGGTRVFAQIDTGIDAADPGQNEGELEDIIQNVINVLLFVVGVAAVVMLIVGGIRYVVSAGDQQAVANAKNTVLYSIVGVVVAFLAFVAVEFVFNQLQG
ncbi:MAG TPA: pilin [Candidatus Saccharimonadales bacterium]